MELTERRGCPNTSRNLTAACSARAPAPAILQQALLDLADWAEQGIAPPASTAYEVVDGQVHVPKRASDRKGIQATVEVTANGTTRAAVAVGESVEFSGFIEVPWGTGTIVAAEWDFEGTGEFAAQHRGLDGSASRYTVTAAHAFTEPGTYFPALRVSTQRKGDVRSRHARALNLGRVRVVVE